LIFAGASRLLPGDRVKHSSHLRRAAILWILSQFLSVSLAQTGVQIQIGQNFAGSDNTELGITPADGDGAIGPKHYIEFINGVFAIYAKTNGLRVRRVTDAQFWANAGVVISTDATTSDPRVIYDPLSQRWFASQVDLNSTASDPTTWANNFLIAVSDTADPTGGWHGKSFVADPDTGYFADFPTLGLDANALYISGDMFVNGSTSVGSSLWSIPKADLLLDTTPAVITNATWHGVITYPDRGEILQPATCVDGSSSGDILAAASIATGDTLILSKIPAASTTNASLADSTKIPVAAYSFPIDPVQPDGTATLADNDSRLSARVYTVGGVMFAVQNIEVNARAAIRWYRISATNQTLLESGTITDSDLDLFYPSIAANVGGVIVIGCNGCSLHQPISSLAYAGLTVNGVTTFSGPKVLRAGTIGNYHDSNELLGGATESRWGDYSATTPDPSDASRFWTIQMLPFTSSTWATQITEILVLPPLSIVSTDTDVTLSWPLFAVNYQLQSSPDITGPWTPVLQTVSTNANQFSVTVPQNGSQQFFRLAEQQ
jgi:hypothetical protein